MHGVPEFVLVRGRISAENGTLRVGEGFGRFIPMAVRPPFVYDIIEGKVQRADEPHEEYQNGNMTKKFAELDILIPAPEPVSAMLAGNIPMPAEGSVCSTPSVRGRVDGKRDMQESSFSISGNEYLVVNIFTIDHHTFLFALQRNWTNQACALA